MYNNRPIIVLKKHTNGEIMLIILFGLTGAGKNFVGEILEKRFGYTFWDADEALSADMKECIRTHKAWTQEMRETYINNINQTISQLKKIHPNLVVAQALYGEDYRLRILKQHPKNILFIQIATSPDITLKRVISRFANGNSLVDEKYAKQTFVFFQMPSPKFLYMKLHNNHDSENVIMQLELILEKKPKPVSSQPRQLRSTL